LIRLSSCVVLKSRRFPFKAIPTYRDRKGLSLNLGMVYYTLSRAWSQPLLTTNLTWFKVSSFLMRMYLWEKVHSFFWPLDNTFRSFRDTPIRVIISLRSLPLNIARAYWESNRAKVPRSWTWKTIHIWTWQCFKFCYYKDQLSIWIMVLKYYLNNSGWRKTNLSLSYKSPFFLRRQVLNA
jgi:hypothetical protein